MVRQVQVRYSGIALERSVLAKAPNDCGGSEGRIVGGPKWNICGTNGRAQCGSNGTKKIVILVVEDRRIEA